MKSVEAGRLDKLIQRAIPRGCIECHMDICKDASCKLYDEVEEYFTLRRCKECTLYPKNGVCKDNSCLFAEKAKEVMEIIKVNTS